MKQIIENRYIKIFKFASSKETATFASNQKVKKYLSIDDTYGDNYYCYIAYHSLTREKQFILLFNSDESEDNLNFLFWDNLFVLDTGKNIYFIDKNLNIKVSFEINIRLIGLYVVNKNHLLVLEEASYKILNLKGEVLKSESLDLIEDFNIEDNLLLIQTSEGSRVIELMLN